MASSRFKSPLKKLITKITEDVLEIFDNDQDNSAVNLSEYSPGGHMPIAVNQTVGSDKQYEILQKLGKGQFSTVWFCKDKSNEQACFALKVTKGSTKYQRMAYNEVNILHHINNGDSSEVGYNRIILLHDYFIESSLNGEHVCMTFEVMGPTLFDLLKQNDFCGFHQELVKMIVKQILEGLKYLHEKCNIVHADLKLDNIMVTVNRSHVSSIVTYAEWFNKLGVSLPKSSLSSFGLRKQNKSLTQRNKTGRRCGIKKKVFKKNHNAAFSSVNTNIAIEIKIADFGNARYNREGQHGTIQAISYRAPEVIIDAEYSFPVDLWSVGCLTFEFSTGMHLFYVKNSQNCPLAHYHLGLIWRVCNGIPKRIALRGKQSKEFFDEMTGELKKIKKESLIHWRISDCFVQKFNWKFIDARLLEGFLMKLIEPDPEARATASEALEDEWLKS
ncbi:hypothetical protein ILUMI_06071 [Ignelater luminosus]|uniref:non-specific serine/threonine protein kinase n=1 Tax=Ignelater luminosus TaxID=2038154 RepID=A0A8K0DGD5_IGNLU|nr:hypothetical protein ILUMI_06071 [Ignelater luminosus]